MSAKLVSITMLLLLPALAEAQPAVRCPQSAPLSEDQLTKLVKGSVVPDAPIRQYLASCGIDFEADGGVIGRLRSAGASETVVDAVRAAIGPAERKRQAEQVLWESIKDSPDPMVFEDYLRRYPEGQFAAPARQRYGDLKVAGIRPEMERSLAAGQWDAADGKIRDLLRGVSENDEIRGWQRQIAGGREKLLSEKEGATRAVAPSAAIAAGTTTVNPKDGLTYVWIPPGTFMMGCSPGDNECFPVEKPAHRETITRGFWLGQTSVTQQAYQRVTGQNPSVFKGVNLPVESVDWDEAKAYCVAIGGRLPTEAEWEYAARAGSTDARYGNLDEIAWHKGNSGFTTHGVGQKQANAFGLYDMLGNVQQWTADWFGDYPSGAQSDRSGAVSGQDRVLRGGSCGGVPRLVRVSARNRFRPGNRGSGVGLRCVGEGSKPPALKPTAASPTPAAPVIAPAAVVAGTTEVNPKDGLTYVWIPPGKFQMGCSPSDSECDNNEKPAHEVTITRGFWMGQTAVTVDAWKRYVQARGKSMPAEPVRLGRALNPGWRVGQQPVVNVNWEDAAGFCAWNGGRLPTEAEWEYAGRAATDGARYGDLDEIAWYADNSGLQRLDSRSIFRTDRANYFRRLNGNGDGPHPVELKRPNGWNLYDMLGNVWQWTSDWYGENYYGQRDTIDPKGPLGGDRRAMRGGSWDSYPSDVRVSYRYWQERPDRRGDWIGFRCVGE